MGNFKFGKNWTKTCGILPEYMSNLLLMVA
jgi:hypothetical protein